MLCYKAFHDKSMSLLKRASLALLLGILVGACSFQKSLITGSKTAYGYSWQQELQIGREADPAITAEYGLYDDEELARYVSEVGQRVLEESHMRRPDTPPEYRIDFTFRVLDSPILNAFALPGGYVYVTRGLLAHMENEAQLAMVLGHEIGHVAARHSSQQAFKSQVGQLGLIGGAVVGEVLAGAGAELLQVGSAATQLLLMSYSRGHEHESDELGVEYSAKSGYQAGEGAGFFVTLKRMSDKAGARIPSWQSTHPDPGDRELRILDLANQWSDSLDMTDVGRDPLFAAIDGIVVGANPRQGFVKNNVFLHPDLAFRFPVPSGWELYNLTTKVAMTDPQQQSVVILTLASGASPEDAASEFVTQSQVNVREHRARTINGLDAYYVDASFMQEQQSLRLVAYFIAHGDLIYQFISYTDAGRFNQMSRGLKHAPEGFAVLRDRQVLGIQPNRLQVRAAPRSASLRNFITSIPEPFTDEDVAILNQLQLTSRVDRGYKLKLIQ